MMKRDSESIENQLFTLKLEGCGTVQSYYDTMRTLWDDLEFFGQPRPTDQQYLRIRQPSEDNQETHIDAHEKLNGNGKIESYGAILMLKVSSAEGMLLAKLRRAEDTLYGHGGGEQRPRARYNELVGSYWAKILLFKDVRNDLRNKQRMC